MVKIKVKVFVNKNAVYPTRGNKVDEIFINIKNDHITEIKSCDVATYNDILLIECNKDFFKQQIKEALHIDNDDIEIVMDKPFMGKDKRTFIHRDISLKMSATTYASWIKRKKRVEIINKILE